MTVQLAALIVAHLMMAAAAIDYTAKRRDCWPELLGASYALAMGATL